MHFKCMLFLDFSQLYDRSYCRNKQLMTSLAAQVLVSVISEKVVDRYCLSLFTTHNWQTWAEYKRHNAEYLSKYTFMRDIGDPLFSFPNLVFTELFATK